MTEEVVKQPKTVEQMTVEELKALAYDQIMLFNQTQANINIIQAELVKREKHDQLPGA